MGKRILLQLILLLVLCTQVWAQKGRTITGRILSEGDDKPLEGVTVTVKGTTVATSTDKEGKFSIAVPDGSGALMFSFVGYEPQERVLTSQTNIDLSLKASPKGLNEVLVIGYGTQKRKDVSGAVSSIKGTDFENMTVQSLDKAMQGRAAGVQVNTNSGVPGGASEVRIRGTGSVNAGNQPLYIIDGVQITPETRTRNLASSNPLSTLNTNDIESIEILKDASAASIYGAQAGNGVIIVTTKKGKYGKPVYNADLYWGFTDMTKKPDLLNGPEWLALRREAAVNSGVLTAPYSIDQQYGDAKNAPSYDWIDAVTRKGQVANYELSVAGGNDNTRYFIGGSFNDQKYQFIGYDFKRGTFRVNLDNKLSKKLSLETRLNLSTVKQNSSDIPSFQLYNPFIESIALLPLDPIYNKDGTYNLNLIGGLGGNGNPVSFVEKNKNLGITNQAIGNIALNYEIFKGLKFRSSFSLEYTDVSEELYYDPRTPAGTSTNGTVRFSSAKVVNWQTDQTLTYNTLINDRHSITGLLGFNYRNEVYTTVNTQGNGTAIPAFGNTLTGTTPATVASTYSQYKLAGVFGRLGYTLDDKYILQFTLRRDGSSRFGADNQFGYFPAASVAWRLSGEKFMEKASFLSDLKLRVSYGETGNSQFLSGTAESNFPALSLYSTTAGAAYNNTAGITFSQLGNADLGWERNVTTNFGLDYGFFDGRISGSFDYFIRTTKDLLLSRPLVTTSGFSSIAQNVGSLENKGFEIAITTKNLVGDFKWTTDFNITFLKNKVKSLLKPGEDLPNSGLWVGQPIGQLFLVRWAGVNPANGRPMWYDADGDITYSAVAADRVFTLGSTRIPDHFGGFTNTFSWKGIELSAFFQWQVGTWQQDQPLGWLNMDFRYEANQNRMMLERWTTPGQLATVPKAYPGENRPGTASTVFGNSGANHDRFFSDASYIRLKNITAAYTLPASLLSKIKVQHIRVYVQGYNLWTGTNYTGFDPEFTANGYNMGLAPQGTSFTAGVQFSF
jgi:TonB-linked SusC/RagA family outer membrane protein